MCEPCFHSSTRSASRAPADSAGCRARDRLPALGRTLQVFGSEHADALAMELVGRAGDLVPTNRISLRDVANFGRKALEALSSGILERDPDIAQRLYDPAAAE